MKRRKGILLAAGLAVLLCAAVLGVRWRTQYKRTEILSVQSGDSSRTLTVYMVGEPEFPYGSTRGLIVLSHGGERTAQVSFSVQNDGANLRAEDFDEVWSEDGVSVTVRAAEQEACVYTLYFDGRTKQGA